MNGFVLIRNSNNSYYLNRALSAGKVYLPSSISCHASLEILSIPHVVFTVCATKYVYVIHNFSKIREMENVVMVKTTESVGNFP
ncbi:MAG TPA: hypothetical protein VNR87_14125 [Flavisolibacter sp.]|nr:hypothetical protein [Flavisolibacter sp.]